MNTSKVVEWGKGNKILVFLHYFGGAADSWQWVAQALSPKYCCIALNLPGFGGTAPLQNKSILEYTRYIRDTLQALGINKFTLIGHSMSGKFALQMAAEDTQQQIEQILLVAPSPPTVEPMPAEEKQRMLKHPDREIAETTVKNAAIKPLTKEQHALAVDTQMIIDNATWQWWLLEGMNHAIADQMDRVKAPVTVLASEDDPAIPYDTILSEVIGKVPGAALVSLKGVGHLLPLEVPKIVAAQIERLMVCQA